MKISVFLLLLFFHWSKSNQEEDFRKATQLYENTVGETVDTRHIELKGEPKTLIDLLLTSCAIFGIRKKASQIKGLFTWRWGTPVR